MEGRKTGGRQKGSLNKSTLEIKELARAWGPAAIARLAKMSGLTDEPASASVSEQTQLGAMKELLDRGYGRPNQALTDPNGGALVFQILTGVPRQTGGDDGGDSDD